MITQQQLKENLHYNPETFSKIEDAALARANGSLKYQGQFVRIET